MGDGYDANVKAFCLLYVITINDATFTQVELFCSVPSQKYG